MDPVEEWEKLQRRINLAYYVGQASVDVMDAQMRSGSAGRTTAPPTLGIDVDNDGQVDANYTKND